MRKLLTGLCIIIGLVGCTSNDAGYQKVQVSASESKALSALSNIQAGSSKSSGQSVNGVSLKAAIFK